MRLKRFTVVLLAVALTGCPKGYQNLAVASDAVAHSLKNTEDGINLAVQSGVMTPVEKADFDEYIIKAALAGKKLDAAIHVASQNGTSIQTQVDAFLEAFRKLETQGLGIRDAHTRMTINLALTSTESAVAIIAALGTKK